MSASQYKTLVDTLHRYLSIIVTRSVIDVALKREGLDRRSIDRRGLSPTLLRSIDQSVAIYFRDREKRAECSRALRTLGSTPTSRENASRPKASTSSSSRPKASTSSSLRPKAFSSSSSRPKASSSSSSLGVFSEETTINVDSERDIVVARRRARSLATAVGFDNTEQIKVVTAVSEVTRNIFSYAGSGEVTLRAVFSDKPRIEIVAHDDGPGIDLDEVMSDGYRSRTGMGLGLKGCRRLMNSFEVDSNPGKGTTVTMVKLL